ncbi:uncharacterized protein [Maniola hyperantus]|uniref:uncharacterized protein n=1 Tax=Aphantopus hyperantus TaxID=2795564 RepID=UPI002141ADC8
MVIIAVRNIPAKSGVMEVVNYMTPLIKGPFEMLHFTRSKKGSKNAYIRLAERQSTKDVIQRINAETTGPFQLKAFIPDNVADLPEKPLPKPISKQVIAIALDSIMTEMQTKYTGLYRISDYTQHELIETIGMIVYERLKHILDDPIYSNLGSFRLTRTYRKAYPHDTDFQFIIDNLHSIQDAQGKPRTNPHEGQMKAIPLVDRAFHHLSLEMLDQLCQNHITRISQKLVAHVKGLEVKEETSTPEEAATMRVRKHLKNLAPYLPSMVQRTISNYLLPADVHYCMVKIYGEPYLPSRDIMAPFTQLFHVTNITRSTTMYNLLSLKVPRELYLKLLKADGTVISRAKLVIRPGKLPLYEARQCLQQAAEDERTTEDQPEEEDMDCSES